MLYIYSETAREDARGSVNMNAEKMTRTGERNGERRKRENEADSCFACGHPERLVC